ncbi:hypothetical protein [Streptomyces sp. NPDC058861]|uniref:hypothetical protein n=1 Tax=Streptomyces sp. NPDC058861 TaxID=3346653 RepID=UPI0036A0D8B8
MAPQEHRQMIGEVLALTDPQYRFYTAIHEVGHAATALATGNCSVISCELMIVPGAVTDAFTDIRYVEDHTAQRTQLIYLHGGLLAQERWMREARLWTPGRSLGTREAARHDFAAMEELTSDESSIRAAHDESHTLVTRHWQGIMEAARRLSTEGRITGQEICDLLNANA